MSEVIALPPAPAISSAPARGATSRMRPTKTALPVAEPAPSCQASSPTCKATVAPSGRETSSTGTLVTLARNQHWSTNSHHQFLTSQVRRKPSRTMTNRSPT
ncbi:hypothetical protein GCM10010176_087700 [Nonomuraea spiralis]|nr:hypothetical protein GCM10010176_087700 [Nonomuraea spiralis]